MFSKNRPWFKALLKTADGVVAAEGRGSIVVEERAVNFAGDFVPLFTLGTPLEIVRIENGEEIHRFRGKVYISDKRLLRLTSVDDELLSGSENVYCDNFHLNVTLLEGSAAAKERGFFGAFLSKKPFDVQVSEISEKELIFLFDIRRSLEVGSRYYIQASELPELCGLTVQITEPLLFGLSAAYRCRFVDLDGEKRERLKTYLVEYNAAHNKLF